MSAGGSAAAAAIAAAEAKRRADEEEGSLTRYSNQDLADGWEFKILRSATSAFKNPKKLAQVLAEEERAGWVLVEKFDNARLRLKRPAGYRTTASELGFDPYRSFVGMSETRLLSLVLGLALGVPIAIALVVMIFLLFN